LRYVPVLAEVLYVAPTFLAWLAFWSASYCIESANRERSLPYRFAQGLPAHPMPTLAQFLSLQVRHNFYILAPFALHASIIGASRFLTPVFPYAEEVAAPLGILAVLLITPWILARLWSTVPLTGPLRARLDAVAAAYRLRFRNILVWRTHNAVTNAAILGWVPYSRYFLMTDALLETLSDRQLEAVFAHEVGHGVHRHIVWYLVGIIGAVSLSYGAAVFWETYLPPNLAHILGTETTAALISMLVLVFFLGVAFPWVSRRFEHQADFFAARHMARKFQDDPTFDGKTAIPAQLLPPEIGGGAAAALSLMTTPAEVVTLQQYLAGTYPHAAAALDPPVGPSVAPPPPPASPLSPLATAPATSQPWTDPSAAATPTTENAIEPRATLNVEPQAAATVEAHAPPFSQLPPPALRTFTPAQAGAELFISALDTILDLSHRARNRGGWMHPSPNQRMALLRRLATQPAAVRDFSRRMLQTRLAIIAVMIAGLTAGTAGVILEVKASARATHPATTLEATPTAPASRSH
jgi:Zn-dependent protease with chaperone function